MISKTRRLATVKQVRYARYLLCQVKDEVNFWNGCGLLPESARELWKEINGDWFTMERAHEIIELLRWVRVLSL